MTQDETRTTISKGPLQATIDSFGAQLVSLKREGIEYLWQGDPHWWKGQAPVLFPIVGRLRNDKAQTSQGPTTMKQHGIARISPFELVEAVEDKASFELTANDDTKALYPFDFSLVMTYSLDEDEELCQTFTVTNTGEVDLPFVVGGHPAFNVPLNRATGENFNDYQLRFATPWTAVSPLLNEEHLWDWEKKNPVLTDSDVLPLSHRLFDVDTIAFRNVPGSMVTLEGTKSGMGVTVSFPDFEYLGVWSKGSDAPFVALEPWTGCATSTDETDELAAKRGMTLLAPDGVFERSFTINPF